MKGINKARAEYAHEVNPKKEEKITDYYPFKKNVPIKDEMKKPYATTTIDVLQKYNSVLTEPIDSKKEKEDEKRRGFKPQKKMFSSFFAMFGCCVPKTDADYYSSY